MTEIKKSSPKCFISYSWDSSSHQEWVRNLATKLHQAGVFTHLDQWDLKPGQDMMEFMEYSVRTSDFVFLICTQNFAEKANTGRGGVGYEKSIVTGEVFYSTDENTKFIPLIVEGNPKNSLPSFLKSKVYIDFRNDNDFDQQFEELIRNIYDTPKFPKPELGVRPDFLKSLTPINNSNTNNYIQFKFDKAIYNFNLPDWWDKTNVDITKIKKKNVAEFVRKTYGEDVGTTENWQYALKTHALHSQKENIFPIYVAHCASAGGNHELASKVYSELYHLVDFLDEKRNWFHTYLAYETGGEYEAMGQNDLAIAWYKKAKVFLGNKETAIDYYAERSIEQIEYLNSFKKQKGI